MDPHAMPPIDVTIAQAISIPLPLIDGHVGLAALCIVAAIFVAFFAVAPPTK